jgi:ribose 5-phosphate isomerase B
MAAAVSKSKKNKRPTILIASDHAGFDLKAWLTKEISEYDWLDLGPPTPNRVDYPDFAERLGDLISKGEAHQGILICGSGTGMAIAANKIPGVRAFVGHDPINVRLARDHNDANVLTLGSRFLAPEYAAELVRLFLGTPFSRDERHSGRVRKIHQLERKRQKK